MIGGGSTDHQLISARLTSVIEAGNAKAARRLLIDTVALTREHFQMEVGILLGVRDVRSSSPGERIRRNATLLEGLVRGRVVRREGDHYRADSARLRHQLAPKALPPRIPLEVQRASSAVTSLTRMPKAAA